MTILATKGDWNNKESFFVPLVVKQSWQSDKSYESQCRQEIAGQARNDGRSAPCGSSPQ
jgi:hypothetical protein